MAAARSRRFAASVPLTSRGNSTFSATRFHGKRVASWNITEILSGAGLRTGKPSTSTSPAVLGIRPASICRSVDFPHPLGPTRETKLPSRTANEMSCSAVIGARPALKTLRNPRVSMTIGMVEVIALRPPAASAQYGLPRYA